MRFSPPLQPGILLRRYKRFLADIQLPDGRMVTAHTPNTGSMLGCAEPGSRVWLRDSGNPARKYRYSWELVENAAGTVIGINTGVVNHLVTDAVAAGVIGELQGYDTIRPEVRYGRENSRIDLLLSGGVSRRDCYVEIKNVTAVDVAGCALFPDAVSERGRKYLRELMGMVAGGERAVLLFCVQRGDALSVRPADEIDPAYGRALREAAAAGVEVIAYRAEVSPQAIALRQPLAVVYP